MKKYQNVDLLAACEQIMWKNGTFCQENRDMLLKQAAVSKRMEDKHLFLLSHAHGTSFFRERDIFLKDTPAYKTWLSYDAKGDRVLAYFIEVVGVQDGILRGNLYRMDYAAISRRLPETALPTQELHLLYERGVRKIPRDAWSYRNAIPIVQKIWYYSFQYHNVPTSQWLAACFAGEKDPELGKFLGYEFQPQDAFDLQVILQQEWARRRYAMRG